MCIRDRGEFALANQYGELWRHLYDEEAKGELAKLEAETEGCAAKQAEGERRDLEERMKINHRKELEVNISRGMALILGLGAIEWAGSESGLSGATLAGGV